MIARPIRSDQRSPSPQGEGCRARRRGAIEHIDPMVVCTEAAAQSAFAIAPAIARYRSGTMDFRREP